MENNTVEFSVQEFRMLLETKSKIVGKALYELELMANVQNKDVINKLLEEKVLTIVDNNIVSSGFRLTPVDGIEFTEEERNSNLDVLKKTSEIFNLYGGKNTVKVELDNLNDLMFTVTNEDILNCVQ